MPGLGDVSAFAFRGQQCFFICETTPAQKSGRFCWVGLHMVFFKQPHRQFRHGDIGLLFDRAHQETFKRDQPAATGPPLSGQ